MSRTIFECVDGHTCGNPVRLITSGKPALVGTTMSEKRMDFLNNHDWIRKGLMYEPRGHDMMSGSMLFESNNPECDVAVLFVETSGCLPMCGHGTIGTITMALEEGYITPKNPGTLKVETPAGVITISYTQEGEKVTQVKIVNIPSYLASTDLTIDCPVLGELTFDVSYGGNFYAIVDPQTNFIGIDEYSTLDLINWSRIIRDRINDEYSFVHPDDASINGLTHILWTGTPLDPTSDGRNAVFYGEKAIDRSPCGTGTSSRMAQLHAKGKLKEGETFTHESIIGSKFYGKVEKEVAVAGKTGIIPSIAGSAWITGYNKLIIDDEHPFREGFTVV